MTIDTPSREPEERDHSSHARREGEVLGLTIPSALASRLENINNYLQRQRDNALESTPAKLVNNSSNLIGAMDILGEMMVFKATGSNLISKGNHGKPLHYIIDPPRNLFKSVITRAKFDVTLKDLLTPDYYRRSFAEFTDLEKAAEKNLRRGRLINRWQARGMLVSLVGMSATTLLPQKQDDPTETMKMGQLWQDSPTKYVATRFSQALWVPGWGSHVTQFTGLAKTTTGVFSYLSSYRNVAEGTRYFRNRAHGITGIITVLGGLQLMLGIDREQAWKNYGATMWSRIVFIPKSIYNRFYERDKRATWYAGSVGMFQAGNTVAYLIGGAEKDEHGNIVDKKSIRDKALFAAPEVMDNNAPLNAISGPAEIAALQPEKPALQRTAR